MFLEELSPLLQKFMQQPVAFTGGFVSGALRLSLTEDPLRSWLEQQKGQSTSGTGVTHTDTNGSSPRQIAID
jgi:hypothetical protein